MSDSLCEVCAGDTVDMYCATCYRKVEVKKEELEEQAQQWEKACLSEEKEKWKTQKENERLRKAISAAHFKASEHAVRKILKEALVGEALAEEGKDV